MRKISAHRVLTSSGWEEGAVVSLSDEGWIVNIEHVDNLDRQAGVEFYSGVLAPAMFNAHCHLELSHLRGRISAGGGFVNFARAMRDVRNTPRAGEAAAWDARMCADGVGRVADVCNGDSTFELKRNSRIRYQNHCELFGLQAITSHATDLCESARAAGLEAEATPHSTYSLNRRAFAEAVSGGMRQLPLSIHFMESEAETDLYRRRGPLWDWYAEQGLEPDFLDFGGPAERIVGQVPSDRAIMLVHNCCATQRDIDMIMSHFRAPVTWVVCPSSNRYIGGLEPPIHLLRKNGLRIAVGTDSLASNTTLSLLHELSLIRDVPLSEMLGWVCTEPGLVLLEGVDLRQMTLTASTTSRRI